LQIDLELPKELYHLSQVYIQAYHCIKNAKGICISLGSKLLEGHEKNKSSKSKQPNT